MTTTSVLPARASRCTTHHRACDCREYLLHKLLHAEAIKLLKGGGGVGFAAVAGLNGVWQELYGADLVDVQAEVDKAAAARTAGKGS